MDMKPFEHLPQFAQNAIRSGEYVAAADWLGMRRMEPPLELLRLAETELNEKQGADGVWSVEWRGDRLRISLDISKRFGV